MINKLISGLAWAIFLIIASVIFGWNIKPDNGHLVDINQIPDGLICEVEAQNYARYLISVPVDQKTKVVVGVYYYGEKLPQYFIKNGKSIVGVVPIFKSPPEEDTK